MFSVSSWTLITERVLRAEEQIGHLFSDRWTEAQPLWCVRLAGGDDKNLSGIIPLFYFNVC